MRSAAPAETSGRSFECSCNCYWSPARLQFTAGYRQRDRSVRLVPAADSRSSRNGTDSSDLARMETAVPVDQRPATQLKELRDSQLYSWVCISGYATEQSCASSPYLVNDVAGLLLSIQHCRLLWRGMLTSNVSGSSSQAHSACWEVPSRIRHLTLSDRWMIIFTAHMPLHAVCLHNQKQIQCSEMDAMQED